MCKASMSYVYFLSFAYRTLPAMDRKKEMNVPGNMPISTASAVSAIIGTVMSAVG